MYSTSVYLYIQRQHVVVFSGNSPRRYSIVYAKNLKLHKGVDNKIQFQFLDQEQKKIDITGKEFTFRLISYDGRTVLLQKSLVITLPLTGLAELQTTSGDLEGIESQVGEYSLEISDNNMNYPVFTSSEAGARGVVEVVDSIMPPYIPSLQISIPTHATPNGVNTTFYTSVYYTNENSIVTLQPYMDSYTGNIQIQGSTLPDSDWYDIGNSYSYSNATQSDGYTVTGFHPYIRLKFVATEGNITKILAR